MTEQPPGVPNDVADELLGLLACGEVFGFHTLADASARSSDISQAVRLMEMAVQHYDAYLRTRQRLLDSGADADAVIASHAEPLAAYFGRTRSADEYQALVKAYVGNGIAADFVREMSAVLDEDTRDFVHDVLSAPRTDEVVVPRLRAAIAQDQAKAGPLALWGRRLMGEALSQAQRVAADRPELVALIVGEADLAGFQQMMARMTTSHSERMQSLGLYA